MENEQQAPTQSQGKCGDCGACGSCGAWTGKWHKKHWKHRGGGCNGGSIWFVGWLFTIGFLKLTFWKGVFALVVWPYFIGAFFAR